MMKVDRFTVNDNGSSEFRGVLDSLDFNGKVGEEYYEPKMTVLASYFYGENIDKIASAIAYGRILTEGVKPALSRGHKTYFLCSACEKLGFSVDDKGILNKEIVRNRDKIENLRSTFDAILDLRRVAA